MFVLSRTSDLDVVTFSSDLEPTASDLSPHRRACERAPECLRIAVGPALTPVQGLYRYRDLADHLSETLKVDAALVIRRSSADLGIFLEDGAVDLALVDSAVFLEDGDALGLEALVVPQIKEQTRLCSYLVVSSSSRVKNPLDLQGKRIASSEFDAAVGWPYPFKWLEEKGRDPLSFFSRYQTTHGHEAAVYEVMRGEVEAATVPSIAYDRLVVAHPEVGRQTRIAHNSMPWGVPPMVVRRRLDPAFKDALRDALLGMKDQPGGRAILDRLGIEAFVEVPDGLYAALEGREEAN